MAQKFLTSINLNQNELQNVAFQKVGTDPSNLVGAQFWFNTTSGLIKYFDGTNTQIIESQAALETALADYQTKITANGILKGDGTGTITPATAGTDYAYPTITGSTAPTTSTVGAVGQHYLDTTASVEYVCTVADTTTPEYTWVPVTVDISGKQDTITATGILKGAGAGSISAAVAGTDYDFPVLTGSSAPTDATVGAVNQKYYDTANNVEYICTAVDTSGDDPKYTWVPTVTATASRALVTDENGVVVASDITAVELGYLDGVTSNIQTQLDNIPKLNYLDGVSITVSDSATQSDINTAAAAELSSTYASPSKYDAANVQITFTPSDKVKDALYMYNGSAWVFEFYTTTGIQRANGTTAGIIEEAASDSDLTLVDGVATVNVATALRTARTIGLSGVTATAQSFDGSANITIPVTAVPTSILSGEVAVANGGTGKSSITEGNVLVGNDEGGFDELGIDTTVTAASDNLVTSGAVAAAIGGGNVAHKYSEANAALTPSSGTATWTVTHNLNTRDVLVQVYDLATYDTVMVDVVRTSANVVTLSINSTSNISANTYEVVVIG